MSLNGFVKYVKQSMKIGNLYVKVVMELVKLFGQKAQRIEKFLVT